MSAWTTTPRFTASSRARSISIRSKRKIMISTLFRAFSIAFTNGPIPSPGCVRSFKLVSSCARRYFGVWHHFCQSRATNKEPGSIYSLSNDCTLNMRYLSRSVLRTIDHFNAGSAGAQRSQAARERLRMRRGLDALCLAGLLLLVVQPFARAETLAETNDEAILWRDPGKMTARNLLYGSGGAHHQPRGTMVFVEEDHAGTNP